MARTKQTAAKSTGGNGPRKSVVGKASRKTSKRAMTKSSWHVWLVSDREEGDITPDSLYLVRYIIRPGVTEDSWEPRWLLLHEHLQDYVELVDAFKTNGAGRSFEEYCLTNEDPFALAIGDSPDGRCAFHAIKIAASLLGIPSWFSWTAVDREFAIRAARGRPLDPRGVAWTTLRKFVRRLNAAARAAGMREVNMDTFAVNQRQNIPSGANAVIVLDHLLLEPGVYIVAGHYPYPRRRSHAFVMEVTTRGRFASDDQAIGVPLLDFAFTWLGGIQWVRRVALN